MLDELPFESVWVIDFEFAHQDGEPLPDPVICLAAQELRSGRKVELWLADGAGPAPYDVGPSSLFVTYYAPAEWLSHMALGWGVPFHAIDLYAEARAARNGVGGGGKLTEVAARYGVPTIAEAAKEAGRKLAQRGGPWSPEEQRYLLSYCASDVDTTADLFTKMLPGILRPEFGLQHALLRGRYMRALAHVERCGVPFNTELFTRLQTHWGELKRRLITEVDADFGCYEGATFKRARFEELLRRWGLLGHWPRTETGRLSLKAEVFRDRSNVHTALRPLHELRSTLDNLRKLDLPVGSDGRHRADRTGAFGTATGRNAPSGFAFMAARWIRHLMQPEEGRALIYSDYRAQEIHVAARLSGDLQMIEAVESGDPYLWFARAAGLAPPHATKASHGALRDQIKVLMLGTNYGMSARGIAAGAETTYERAEHSLLTKHKQLFPRYWAWSENRLYQSLSERSYKTRFGWPLRITGRTEYRSLLNHPIQSAGADILRLAAIGLTEIGVNVCALIHDAVLTECAVEDIDKHVREVERIMRLAAKVGIGAEVPVDHERFCWPESYRDDRGWAMFDLIKRLLVDIETETSPKGCSTVSRDIRDIKVIRGYSINNNTTLIGYPPTPSIPSISPTPFRVVS